MIQNVPQKKYRLRNGSVGTEYEACQEVLVRLKEKRQEIDDKIEEYQRRLETAEGAPP